MFLGLHNHLRLKAQRFVALGDLDQRGRAKVKAEVKPGTALVKSPITGRDCVFYSLDVAEWQNGTKTPLIKETSSSSFRMEDTTGSVTVNPRQAELLLRKRLIRGHSSDYLGQHRALLLRHRLGMLDEYGELRSLTFRETVVAPGDTIIALGEIRMEADPRGVASSYRDQPMGPVLGSGARFALLLSDAK